MPPRPPLDELLSLLGATLAAEGTTTEAGAGTGDSFIDASLAGAGDNSFVSMLAILYPSQRLLVDSKDITAFDNATGEVTLASAYKGVGAAIPAGVPYKIVTFRFTPAEVAAIEAKLDHAGHGLAALAAALAEILEDTGTDLEAKLDALYPYHGLVYYGMVTGIAAPPKFQCSGLVGFGDDFFEGYWAYVVWDAGGAGGAPQGEMLQCTGYDSAAGDFTVAAFGGGGIATEDRVLLLHPAIASLLNTTYGLSAIKTLIDAVEGKLDGASGLAALKAVVDAIQTIANNLPNAGALNDLSTLETRWTAALATILGNFTALRIGYLDQLDFDLQEALTAIAGYIDTEIQAIITTLGTPANFMADVSILTDVTNGLAAIKAEVEGLAGAAMRGTEGAALASAWTAALAGILANFTALRIGYLDNISGGAVTAAGPTKTEMDNAHALLATLAKQERVLCSKDFWSAAQATAQITTTPGVVALPSVTPSLPNGVTITRAIAMMKFRKVSNADAAANYIDTTTGGPHDPALQVDKAAAGYIDALLLPDTFLRVEGDGIEGGDVLVGDTDIKAKVESAVATTFQLGDDLRCLATTLDLYDIQVGLRIWYSV